MKKLLFSFSLFMISSLVTGQTKVPGKLAEKPYGALPSARQLAWHETETYVLIHFTPTTFENKEWGYGDADPASFNPTAFDANQIVSAAKDGGFKGLVLVAKHHDGFCLWPTKTTDYNISKSPWKNGKGDMVREFEQACRKLGLKFGVYISPWDRNNEHYGTHKYVEIYREQLRELYTQYGELFMSWHDGANGGDGYYGGKRETRNIDRATYYGWDTTWAATRKLQPMANIFSDVGPDVRWVGNEHGEAAATSWATYEPKPREGGKKAGPGESDYHNSPTGTLNGKFWIPAECDVPLRPGWFYHKDQDEKVKSPEKLFDIYLKSVGRGGALDLGLSPDTRGLLHENDVRSLKAFGDILRNTFANNLVKTSSAPKELSDDNKYSHVKNDVFLMEWKSPQTFNVLRIRENIKLGQRVQEFLAEAWVNGQWQTITEATSVGNARILVFPAVTTQKVRVRITKTGAVPLISEIGLYKKL